MTILAIGEDAPFPNITYEDPDRTRPMCSTNDPKSRGGTGPMELAASKTSEAVRTV